jgi:hypothetical protein
MTLFGPGIPYKDSILKAFFMFLFILVPYQSWAQEQSNPLRPLPGVETLNAEDFIETTHQEQVSFEEDPSLSFSFQIHNDWERVREENLKNVFSGGRLIGTVAEYFGAPMGPVRPFFRVQAERIEREISTKNWFLNYVLNRGYVLRSLEEWGENGGFEALYLVQSGRDSFVVRAVGERLGPRMIIAEYGVPSEGWRSLSDYQTLIIQSFVMTGEDKDPIEEKEYYAYLEAIEFSYPKGWRLLNENTEAENRLYVELVNSIGSAQVVGNITVDVISTRSVKSFENIEIFNFDPSQEIKAIKQRFEQGYKFEGLLEKKEYDLPETVSFQVSEVHALEPVQTIYDTYEDGLDTHELWFTVIYADMKYYIFTLLTPSRSQDLYSWAVNKQSYENVIQSIRLR